MGRFKELNDRKQDQKNQDLFRKVVIGAIVMKKAIIQHWAKITLLHWVQVTILEIEETLMQRH